jgi:hypothetical protein
LQSPAVADDAIAVPHVASVPGIGWESLTSNLMRLAFFTASSSARSAGPTDTALAGGW